MRLLLVLVGAGIGAPLRYLTDRAVQRRHDTIFPWGTFTVNVVGSMILGLVAGATSTGGVPHQVQLLVGTEFCGALTTYSTFSYETLRLIEQRARFLAAANVAASIVAGLGGAFIGAAISQAIWPWSPAETARSTLCRCDCWAGRHMHPRKVGCLMELVSATVVGSWTDHTISVGSREGSDEPGAWRASPGSVLEAIQ